jgi:choline kinase
MKVIILAAGMGTRLGKYTENLPKCMLNFLGKSLIERQVETLRSCGLHDIIVVTGYQNEKIKINGVKYYQNEKYAETNMVESLFSAEEELSGEILIAYADILYEKRIINQIIKSPVDVGVTVDDDYWDYWQARLDDPISDIESLVINGGGNIIELGKACDLDLAQVRYVGLIKLSDRGTETLKQVYHRNKELYYNINEPWLGSKSFKFGYMTSILQAIINSGYEVRPIVIRRGWMEFDTVDDYEKANKWAENNTLQRFINL